MRVGGSIGTALFAVVLQHQIRGALPASTAGGEGALGALGAIPPAARDRVAPALADAFAHTFWWPVGVLLLALIPALLLPRRRPAEPAEGPQGAPAQERPGAAGSPQPVSGDQPVAQA
jgi:hypothetical protein